MEWELNLQPSRLQPCGFNNQLIFPYNYFIISISNTYLKRVPTIAANIYEYAIEVNGY